MITKIRACNFLSLKDVELNLGKLNVLVGPNGSGKSNVVKVLTLLGNHARSGFPTLDEGSNIINFTDMVYNFNNHDVIELSVEIPHKSWVITYNIKIGAEGYEERIFVDGKPVYFGGSPRAVEKTYYITNSGREVRPPTLRAGTLNILLRRIDGLEVTEEKSVYLEESLLKDPPSDAHESILEVSRVLKGVRTFRLDPMSLRLRSSVLEEPKVGYRGEGLARYILYLYLERRRDFERVEEVLKSLVAEVEEVVPHLEKDNIELLLKSRGLKMPIKPGFISDGTLRIMALASLLYAGFSVIAIEEPENHVHPHLLEALIDLARKSPSQVVFTTHSPHLLDYLRPEEVYVVGKVGTETRIKRLTDTKDVEVIQRFLEEGGTLGEAWFSKMFGEPS